MHPPVKKGRRKSKGRVRKAITLKTLNKVDSLQKLMKEEQENVPKVRLDDSPAGKSVHCRARQSRLAHNEYRMFALQRYNLIEDSREHEPVHPEGYFDETIGTGLKPVLLKLYVCRVHISVNKALVQLIKLSQVISVQVVMLRCCNDLEAKDT
jgi:hypothetical protein